MKAQFSHVHWSRVLLTGVLISILVVILNTVLLLLASNVWGPPSLAHPIAYQVASWSTSILAILLTVGGGVWVARKVERAAPLHGFLVGLVAALILFPFSPALTNFLGGAYRGRLDLLAQLLGTFFLMVAAGWLGGVLGNRGRAKS
jgi:hypothetical protein